MPRQKKTTKKSGGVISQGRQPEFGEKTTNQGSITVSDRDIPKGWQNLNKITFHLFYALYTHNINLVGHSAGAHLVAMALTKSYSINSFINSAVLISGIYQPQITRDISINDIINISEKTINLTDVYKHSLIHNTNFLVITGDEEPEAWKLLSKNYCKWLKNKGINFEYFNAINLNHFSIVRDLSNQNTSLSKKVLKMCNKL